MKNIILLCLIGLFVVGCNSVEKYNRQIDKLHSERELKSDVDFVYHKLKKLHPDLYWYISKKELDFKFDSLKSSIDRPMKSTDFYFKISPVVSLVRQGHLQIIPVAKKLTRHETSDLVRKGIGPLSQFEFKVNDNKLYIIKNNSRDKSIQIGSEVIAVNEIKPQELFSKYKTTYSSDGYNKTYLSNSLGQYFTYFYFYEKGICDSLLYQLKFNDTIRYTWIKRGPIDDVVQNKEHIKLSKVEKIKKRDEIENKIYYGYNKISKKYSKNFSILKTDSTVAIMKINDFIYGRYRAFYRDCFFKMDSLGVKTLILDLRGNPGGKIRDIYNLYSYLVDSNFYFIDKSNVVSRTSVIHVNFFKGKPLLAKIFLSLFYPPYIVTTLLKVNRIGKGQYCFNNREAKLTHPKSFNFNGKLYVLIDGGSFSASCILSSNLKGSKRAVFVGEETGGAYNGTVAGIMPAFVLPNSKLTIRIGLMTIRPHFKSDVDGHGIYPDMEIIPTLENRIKGVDPEMNWVIEQIKK